MASNQESKNTQSATNMRPGGPGSRHGMGRPKEKAKKPKQTLRNLWDYLSQEKSVLWLILGLVVVSSAMAMLGPYFIGVAIDVYILPADFRGLFLLILLMIAVYSVNALSTWLQQYLMIGVSQKTVFNIRRDLFGKLQTLPLSFFDSRPHGEVMSRLTNDIENVSNVLNNSISQVFAGFVTIIGVLAMMLWLSPLLTLFTILSIPLMAFSTAKIASKTRKYFAEQQKNLGILNGFVEETISGQRVVKVFNREKVLTNQFEDKNNDLKSAGIRAQIFSGMVPPLMNVLNHFNFILVASVGGWLAVEGIITVGIIASFISYSRQFARPLRALAGQFNMLQSAIAGAERVFEVLGEEPEKEDIADASVLTDIQGKVDFKNVSFAYELGTPVLKNVNLSVETGQTIALVGPTGAGKTTIINLLTRFYDINEGTIEIDGVDIRNIKRSNLRSLLGIVLQDTYLFSESVRENIRYGRLDAFDEEVEEAARLANADIFINRLPQGYDTVLLDNGGDLSQGQRQLLAIARVVLADPAILILDEATSSVDTRTEIHIQEAMLKIMEGRTCFVIAHRLSTIRDADSIVVIDNGEIIEKGTHQELLKQHGFYYDLYMSQFNRQVS